MLREENDCALCGGPVDKTLEWHNPGAPQVDHLLPISMGGHPTARENVRLTHRWCNRQRSNKVETAPVEPRTSRSW